MHDDRFQVAEAAFQDLVDAISSLRAAALQPSRERGHKILTSVLQYPSLTDARLQLEHDEHIHIMNHLPSLHTQSKVYIAAVVKEKETLEQQDTGNEQDMIDTLEALRQQANKIQSAATAMIRVSKAALIPEKQPERIPDENSLPAAIETSEALGEAITELDELFDAIVEKCDEVYQDFLESGQTPKQASVHRTFRQDVVIVRYALSKVEKAQELREAFAMNLREVEQYRTFGGEVDEEIWECLGDAWKVQLRKVKLYEGILFRAAKGVFAANK
jgi:hypothetical protein